MSTTMRLGDYCYNDCGKPHVIMNSFMIGASRYRFCSMQCLLDKLKQLRCEKMSCP